MIALHAAAEAVRSGTSIRKAAAARGDPGKLTPALPRQSGMNHEC
jgi:hypothetical protein